MEDNKKKKKYKKKPCPADQNSIALTTKNENDEKQTTSKPGRKRHRRTAAEKREANRLKRLSKLESETPEQRQKRRERYRIHKLKSKLKETLEQRFARLERDRKHKALVKMRETPEQREARLAREREYKARARNSGKLEISDYQNDQSHNDDKSSTHREVKRESPEQRQNRLEKERIRKRQARENETPEQKNLRLERDRLRKQRERAQGKLENIQAEHGHFLSYLDDTPDNLKQRKARLEIDCLRKKIKRELEKSHKSDSILSCKSVDLLENSSESGNVLQSKNICEQDISINSSQSYSNSRDTADCAPIIKSELESESEESIAGSEASFIKQEGVREDERICRRDPLDQTESQQENETDLDFPHQYLVVLIKEETEE